MTPPPMPSSVPPPPPPKPSSGVRRMSSSELNEQKTKLTPPPPPEHQVSRADPLKLAADGLCAYEVESPAIIQFAMASNVPAMTLLLEETANAGEDAVLRLVLTQREPYSGKTAVHLAARYNDVRILKLIISHMKSAKDLYNLVHDNKNTRLSFPLHEAAVANSIGALKTLLALEVIMVNVINIWNETPLHLAAAAGHPAAVQQLLLHPATCDDLVDKWGNTALETAASTGEHHRVCKVFEDPQAPLPTIPITAPTQQATVQKKLGLAKLLEYPGEVDDIAELIGDPDLELMGKDMYSWTALHKICSWDRLELLDVLLPVVPIDQVNTPGGADDQTIMHCCVENGALRVLCALVKFYKLHDLPMDLPDKRGITPVQLAQAKGYTLEVLQGLGLVD